MRSTEQDATENESQDPGSRANSGRNTRGRYWLFASVVVVVVVSVIVIAGIGAGAGLGVVPVPGFVWSSLTGAKPLEHSASYYPAETSAYIWLTLAPEGNNWATPKTHLGPPKPESTEGVGIKGLLKG